MENNLHKAQTPTGGTTGRRNLRQKLCKRSPYKLFSTVALSLIVLSLSELPASIAQSVDLAPVIQVPQTNNNGNQQSCGITISREGVMQPSIDNKVLSSSEFLGEPAIAQISATNSSYRMYLENPLGFKDSPIFADQGTIFSTTVTGRGATSFTETQGEISRRLQRGVTNLEINFTARRVDTPFLAGNYSAELTLRCE